jgi:hypothetical protein
MDGQIKKSDWDLDYRFGQQGEETVAKLIETAEVKTDRRWKETGNLYIETQCWSHNYGQWYPSGITATKASHWAFNLDGLVIIIETNRVRLACAQYGREIKCDIPPNFSVGYLITAEDLLRVSRGL